MGKSVLAKYQERPHPYSASSSMYSGRQPAPRRYFDYLAGQQYPSPRDSNRDVERPRQLPRYNVSQLPPSPRGPPPGHRYGEIHRQAPQAPPTIPYPHPSASFERAGLPHLSYFQGHYRASQGQYPNSLPSILPSSSARQDRFDRFMPGPQHSLPHAVLPEAPPKRPTLECTVCGPGAAGPWRRGPIGPYTLCSSCAKIEWKEDDASLPANLHEALSLLDNMRLIRLASVVRKMTDKTQEDLARRLQSGLPDSTYSRTEDFFSRQAQSLLDARVASASPPTVEIAYSAAGNAPSLISRQRPVSRSESRPTEKRARTPSQMEAPLQKRSQPDFPAVKRESAQVPKMSPQSIAITALIEHRQARSEVVRAPLTPVRKEALTREDPSGSTSARQNASCQRISHSDTVKQGDVSEDDSRVVEPMRQRSSRITSTKSYCGDTKPFPFRRMDQSDQQSKSRIIDRRRARNESLRQKYLQKRAEAARAREYKAGQEVAQSSSTEEADKKPVQTPPASSISSSSLNDTPGLSDPPTSLKNILESTSDSS